MARATASKPKAPAAPKAPPAAQTKTSGTDNAPDNDQEMAAAPGPDISKIAADTSPQPPRKPRQLKPGLLRTSEYERQEWFCRVPNETLLSDIAAPGYFVHHSDRIKPGALIEVVTLDYSLDVLLRVVAVAEGLVYTNPLRIFENGEYRARMLSTLTEEPRRETEQPPEGYKVGRVPNRGFYVKLMATGGNIYEALPTRSAAIAKANEHAKKAAGAMSPAA